MILDFVHQVETRFIFGKNAEMKIGEELSKLNVKNVLIHHDDGKFLYTSGLLENIKNNIKKEGISVAELGGVKPNPRVSLVREGISICRKKSIDFILAIGGGSVIDSAKAIGLGFYYSGDVWDFFEKNLPGEKALPIGVILTCPATGSESGNAALINNEELGLKRAYTSDVIRPKFAFLNPELTYSLPDYVTSCGVVDIYSHVIERYFAPQTSIGVMDYLCEAIFRCLLTFGPKVRKTPLDYDTRAEVMWCGTIAHNDTCGVGRIQDWGSHMIAHEISALYDTAHGATLSIIIPAWMKYVYKNDLERFARYAVSVHGIEYNPSDLENIALMGIKRTIEFFKTMGLPTTFKEANLPVDKLEEMAKKAADGCGGTVGNFVPLKYQDVLNILQMAIG